VQEGAKPAGNWVTAALPYFADGSVAAVVAPVVAPLRGSVVERAAAAVLESWLGGGSRRARHFPGNVRIVSDYPAENAVVRASDYAAAEEAEVDREYLVAWLAGHGRRTVYTPETFVSEVPPPLFRPHLRQTLRHARARGAAARATGGASVSLTTALSLMPAAAAFTGIGLLLFGVESVGVGLLAAYGVVVGVSALLAAIRFRSTLVGLLAAPALVSTQAAYVAGFVQGLVTGK
jgi:hypothetical protein